MYVGSKFNSLLLFLILVLLPTLKIQAQLIKYQDAFALYVNGHGYLKYESRSYGINLNWSTTPVYEWKFINNQDVGPIQSNVATGLYNITANDFVVYASRDYGINLKWLHETSTTTYQEWQPSGNLTASQPCITLKNTLVARTSTKSYLTYGSREYGINLVWGARPGSCNFTLRPNPVITRIDNRNVVNGPSSADTKLFQQAQLQQDVIGSNFYQDQFIGMAAAERTGVVTMHTDTWFPIDGYKRTVCGKADKYFHYSGSSFTDNDDDLNLNIIPDTSFKGMLDLANTNARTRLNRLITFNHIQAEIDVLDASFKNYFYPSKPYAPQLNRKVCAFGPFIADGGEDAIGDGGHYFKPEIHTAEEIWWKDDAGNYILSNICDVSGRFDGLRDGNLNPATQLPYTASEINNTGDDFDTDNGAHTFNGAWAKKPLEGIYAIAFRVPVGKERHDYILNKLAGENYFPTSSQPANKHVLVCSGDTVLTVFESDQLDLNVRFERVSKVAGNSRLQPGYIQGFIVLSVKTGKAFSGYSNNKRNDSGGQLLLKLSKKVISKNLQVLEMRE